MKLKNNILALILSFGLLLTASGCSDSNRAANDNFGDSSDSGTVDNSGSYPADNSDSSDDPSDSSSDNDHKNIFGEVDIYENSAIYVYDALGEEIGSVDLYSRIAFVNGCILYTKANENDPTDSTLEYCLYDIEAKKEYKLGSIADRYYDAPYEALKYGDHLYISVSSGEFFGLTNSTMNIYDIDLTEHSMTPLLEIKGGDPYNSFTVANDKLIVAELLYNGDTDLVEYDLNEKHDSPVVHACDGTDCFVHDSIRHIYADSENIYMVRLDWDESEENYFLYLDKYDFDYNLLDTVDLRDFCIAPYFVDSEWDKINEWKQLISYFFVHNDLIYYENFSATRALGALAGDKINRLLDIDITFSSVYSVSQNIDSYLFLREDNYETKGRNIFYRVDSKTHKTETAEFYDADHEYYFQMAYEDNGKILLIMKTSERGSDRFYYIDVNDLDFEPME
ncbi:MAG: hypothetical protein K2N56_09475 [Oscillospiraceae bacterium]|nr:hypothetical protein [Oscillospiraceae bacterium]